MSRRSDSSMYAESNDLILLVLVPGFGAERCTRGSSFQSRAHGLSLLPSLLFHLRHAKETSEPHLL